MPAASLVDVARTQFARRPVRYSMVSAIAVTTSQIVLLTCQVVFDWEPVPSNITAVAISSGPSYLLNRAWVWGKRGGHHWGKEVLPFWIMSFLGLGLSTLFVHVASSWSDSRLVVSAANLSAFGMLWVVKYFVLDTVLFGVEHRPIEADQVIAH